MEGRKIKGARRKGRGRNKPSGVKQKIKEEEEEEELKEEEEE